MEHVYLSLLEEILIDANKMSEGHEYFRIGGIDISPNNKIMAYSSIIKGFGHLYLSGTREILLLR